MMIVGRANERKRGRRLGRGALPWLLLIPLMACWPRVTPPVISVSESIAASSTPDPTSGGVPTTGPAGTPVLARTSKELLDTAGWLFLDYNGSGVQDDPEPPVVGYHVCANVPGQDDVCVDTDADGRYSFEGLAPANTRVSLHLGGARPQAEDGVTGPERYRYWIDSSGLITAGGYSVVGYVTGELITVPEHIVADSSIHSLDEDIAVVSGENSVATGLVHGVATLPFIEEDYRKISHVSGYDHDPAPESVLSYSGARSTCLETSSCELQLPWQSPLFGISDGNKGLGYWITANRGFVGVVAAHEGQARVEWTEGGEASIVIINTGSGTGIITRYSRLQEALIRSKWYVRRGQLIGYVAPHSNPLGTEGQESGYGLRFEIFSGRDFGEGVGTSKDFFAMEDPTHIVPGFNDASMWTLWNEPQFPFTGTEFDVETEPPVPEGVEAQ